MHTEKVGCGIRAPENPCVAVGKSLNLVGPALSSSTKGRVRGTVL